MQFFSQEEINAFYALLGIGTEEERKRVLALKDLGSLAEHGKLLNDKPTTAPIEYNYGELERTARRDS